MRLTAAVLFVAALVVIASRSKPQPVKDRLYHPVVLQRKEDPRWTYWILVKDDEGERWQGVDRDAYMKAAAYMEGSVP